MKMTLTIDGMTFVSPNDPSSNAKEAANQLYAAYNGELKPQGLMMEFEDDDGGGYLVLPPSVASRAVIVITEE